MPRDNATDLRHSIDKMTYADEAPLVSDLRGVADLSDAERGTISQRGAQLVRDIRADSDPGMMEVFLAEYGLSTDEGIALMCLAEALLRVPDAETIDALDDAFGGLVLDVCGNEGDDSRECFCPPPP